MIDKSRKNMKKCIFRVCLPTWKINTLVCFESPFRRVISIPKYKWPLPGISPEYCHLHIFFIAKASNLTFLSFSVCMVYFFYILLTFSESRSGRSTAHGSLFQDGFASAGFNFPGFRWVSSHSIIHIFLPDS